MDLLKLIKENLDSFEPYLYNDCYFALIEYSNGSRQFAYIETMFDDHGKVTHKITHNMTVSKKLREDGMFKILKAVNICDLKLHPFTTLPDEFAQPHPEFSLYSSEPKHLGWAWVLLVADEYQGDMVLENGGVVGSKTGNPLYHVVLADVSYRKMHSNHIEKQANKSITHAIYLKVLASHEHPMQHYNFLTLDEFDRSNKGMIQNFVLIDATQF